LHPEKAYNDLVQYSYVFDMAVYILSGTCFYDIYPNSNAEIIFAVFAMVLGSLIYGKLFGDLEHAMLLHEEQKSHAK